MTELEECEFERGFYHEFSEELEITMVRPLHPWIDFEPEVRILHSVIQPSREIIFYLSASPGVAGPQIPIAVVSSRQDLMQSFRLAIKEA